MKKYLFLLFFSPCAHVYSQCATYTSAVSDVTLQCTGGTSNRTAIAYFPTKNMYYSVNAGNSSYPIETYTYTGGAALSSTLQASDYRGLWYNPNLGIIEGNSYGSGGTYRHDVSLITGYAMGTTSNMATAPMPNSQSCGAYDPVNDHVLYYNATTIYKYNRTTGALVTSIAITGLPAGNINSYGIIFVGIPGQEVGVYDYTNLAIRFINYTTGAYVSSCQLPPGAPASSSFKFGYANNRFFLYNSGASQWYGYKITNQSDLLFSGSNIVCSGLPITISASGASSYTWSNGSNATSITVSPTVSTVYSIAVTNSAGCISSSNFITTTGTSLSINATASGTFFCGAGSTTLTASGASSYSWSTGATSASIAETPTATTVYSVTGTNLSGCSANATMTVTVENNPTVSIGGTNTICEGTTTSLTANGAATYTWSTGSNSQSVNITPTVNTTYTVSGASPGGCTGGSNTAAITVSLLSVPVLSVATSSSIICVGQTATLSVNGADTFSWSAGGTNSTVAVSPTITSTYTVIGTNTLGCSSTATIVQSVSPCTGIDGMTSDKINYKIYPNPGTGKYTLLINENFSNAMVHIYDLSGKLLLEQEIRNEHGTIDLNDFDNGVYIAVIRTTEFSSTAIRLIKQ